MKTLAIGLGMLLLVLGAGYWWMSAKVTPQELSSLNEEELYYTVTVELPEHTTLNTGADARARATMYAALAETVAAFKQESGVETFTPQDAQIQGLDGGRKYALGAEYDEYHGESTVSYAYRIYMDTLGAHPNHFYRTFTFDMDGNEIALEDLFVPGSSYLTRLSEEAFTRVLDELTTRAGGEVYPEMEDTVRMGTAPSPETLQFFYLTETDLHLLFPPYQVAAYAAGSFDIAIPLSELENILKPEFI
jgi:hypothetical protein